MRAVVSDYDEGNVNILLVSGAFKFETMDVEAKSPGGVRALFECLTGKTLSETKCMTELIGTYYKAGDDKSTVWLLPVPDISGMANFVGLFGAFDIIIDFCLERRYETDSGFVEMAIQKGRQIISVIDPDLESQEDPSVDWNPRNVSSQQQIDRVIPKLRAESALDTFTTARNNLPIHEIFIIDTNLWKRRLKVSSSVRTEEIKFVNKLREMRDSIFDAIKNYGYR